MLRPYVVWAFPRIGVPQCSRSRRSKNRGIGHRPVKYSLDRSPSTSSGAVPRTAWYSVLTPRSRHALPARGPVLGSGGAEALQLNAQALFRAGDVRAVDEALHLWATQLPDGLDRLCEARAELFAEKRRS